MNQNKIILKLDWCSHKAAEYAVKHWHYSKRMPVGKLSFIGVWEQNIYIGCVIFGYSNNIYSGKKFGLAQQEIVELLRVALNKHISKVTRIISIAIKMLMNNNPKLKAIISYADSAQGHLGRIYQAGNWIYIGKTQSDKAFCDEHGVIYHPRTVGKNGIVKSFGKYKKHRIAII